VGLAQNKIILYSKDEAESHAEKELTSKEWESVYIAIMQDENMWQVIDECIKTTLDDLGLTP
jgi:hypothetical protein